MRKNNLLPTKTFSQIVTENPDLYADLNIDEFTQNLLFQEFQYRYVCDDDKFVTFYRRKLMKVEDRYNEALRLSTTNIDWFVWNYREKQTILDSVETINQNRKVIGNSTIEGTTETLRTPELNKTTTGTESELETPNRTTTENYDEDKADTGTQTTTLDRTTDTTTNSKTDSNDTSHTDENTDTNNNQKALSSALPNSKNFNSTETDPFPTLVWTTATDMQETNATENVNHTADNTSNSSSSTDSTGNKSDKATTEMTNNLNTNTSGRKTTSETGTVDRTKTYNLNNKETGKETVNTTENRSNNDTKTDDTNSDRSLMSDTKDRETGRTDASPAEVISKSIKVIYKTSAFEWLTEQLAECFFTVVDMEVYYGY